MTDLKIEILSKKLIKPSNPTPEHLQRYNLSVFDELVPPTYTPMLYYYVSEGDDRRPRHDERCHKLEKSLSQILTKFYPLAGRYMEEELYVDCGDQGVECIEAQVTGELAHFLQPSDSQMHILSKFLPWDVNTATHSSIRPLAAVQINTFDCGGIVLGILISHFVADGFTLATFMKEWAITSRKGTREDFCPLIGQLSSLFPARNCSMPKLPATSTGGANVVTKMFLFEENKIASIKGSLVASDRAFSKVVVVIAMIWKALLEVALAKHGSLRDSTLVLAMNLRGKSKAVPPTLEIACGNYYFPLVVLFEAKKIKAQLHDLMLLVKSAIEKERARTEGANADDLSAMNLRWREEIYEKRCRNDVDFYVSSSWCRFPMYEADFGWGKPYWFSDACRGYEFILLMDSNRGGIEAWINLREEDMNNFKENLDISESIPLHHQ